jgi:hypothetical protein
MSRPVGARAIAVVVAFVAAGCQDYNFNPVGHCLLQPGSQHFTLSNVSSADVLFVVDDSNSMAGKQANLANAFSDFVENLTSTNIGRAQGGLLPLDFHVAVTTTSVFYNRAPLTAQTCSDTCGAEAGKATCCVGTAPVYGPRRCTAGGPASQCPVSGTSCSNACSGLKGEWYCCVAADGSYPPNAINSVGGDPVRCDPKAVLLPCGQLQTHYDFAGVCNLPTKGVAYDQFPFPDGDFVGSTSITPLGANPRVLHFDKRLYYTWDPLHPQAGQNGQGFTMDELKRFFVQNVAVGTCGSPQEQGLAASFLGIENALAGLQKDTYAYNRALGSDKNSTPVKQAQVSVTNGIPSANAAAVWPGPNSKLVVVYVGDEDDCSSPQDPARGVLMLDSDIAGQDACTADATRPSPKETAVASFVDYLTGLGRPLGAAFIVSARSTTDPSSCSNGTCYADYCCDLSCSSTCQSGPPPAGSVCGGLAPGTRFIQAATQLKAKGADVVVGTVCSDFGPTLNSVAEIVKPPQTLSLPSLPAESAIAILRIASANGTTRKICKPALVPLRPTNYTRSQAEETGADWWFSATGEPGPPYDPDSVSTAAPVAIPTKFVYINPKGSCIANPGETYSADYLGVVPQPPPGQPVTTGGCDPAIGAADCQAKLGGQVQDWQCSPIPGDATTPAWGTCTCGGGT